MDGITLIHQEICVIDNFPAKHAITTNSFGDCSFRQGPINEEIQLARLMSLTQANCSINIVPEHKDVISLVAPFPEKYFSRHKCDALLSFKLHDDFRPMLACCTADCPIIFLTDKNRQFGGIIHSGWSGTDLNIVGKTIKQLSSWVSMINKNGHDLDIPLKNIVAAIWSGICQEHFVVGADFRQKFPVYFKELENSKGCVSLKDVIIDQLLDAGVEPDNIIEINICSFHSKDSDGKPLFHSFRRDKNGLRNMAVISL